MAVGKQGLSKTRHVLAFNCSSTLSSNESTRLTWRAACRKRQKENGQSVNQDDYPTSTAHSTGLDPPGSPIPHVPNETNVVCGAAGSFFSYFILGKGCSSAALWHTRAVVTKETKNR